METALSIAIVFATLCGPILAVLVTRGVDQATRRTERRLEIFRSLMSSRRAPLSADKVRALNVVEIEFHGAGEVLRSYQELMAHINSRSTNQAEWNERHRSLMTRLLSHMAKSLGYKIQQLDMLEGGYYPQGFVEIENEQQEVRRALVEVLQGRRPLTVAPGAATPSMPFPPPPPPAT